MAVNNRDLGTEEVLWKLEDLYSGEEDPQLQADCNWCEQESAAIGKTFCSRVDKLSATELYDLVNRLEALDDRLTKLGTYSFLHFTTQLTDAKAGRLDQKIRELTSRCSKETVFFELEWNNLSDEQVHSLLGEEHLITYRHYLLSLRRYRPHQLSEIEEKLLLDREIVGRSAWTTLFSKLISNIRFGEEKRSEEEVLTDLYSPDRTVRKTAADELTAGLKENSHLLTHIFNTLAADKMINDRLRKHSSWISSMNLYNQLEDATVESLVDAVTSRYDLVSRYYRLKQQQMGLEQLEDYDRYAPLADLPDTTIDWETCRQTVLDAFAKFSPDMAEIAQQFFDKSWIHAPVIDGKRGGAFAHPCVPDVHPYVMVNYTGNLRDVSTVAHELGHGVHQVLASEQGHFNSSTPLPLAETASVFAELLTFNAQLEMISSKAQRRAFICQKLESIFATVFRQTAMNRFEDRMHRGRREHGELSTEQLSSYWLETQREMFGDSVTLREDYGIWWSYIPHFLSTPGYVYSYAFGELLVLSLYSLYRKEPDSFVEKYLTLLKAGGSQTPYDLLAPFGIDLNDPTFWKSGLSVIEEFLEMAEA